MIHLVLLAFAFVLFVIQGLGLLKGTRWENIGWFGMALWVLTALLLGIPNLR